MNRVGGNTLEITFFTMKALILYKEPDLAVEHIIYLLGFMLMVGVIWRARKHAAEHPEEAA